MSELPLAGMGLPDSSASAAAVVPFCRCAGRAGGSDVGGLLCLGGCSGLGGGGRFGGTLESSIVLSSLLLVASAVAAFITLSFLGFFGPSGFFPSPKAATGSKLLTLFGGGGRGPLGEPLGVTDPSLLTLAGTELSGFTSPEAASPGAGTVVVDLGVPG